MDGNSHLNQRASIKWLREVFAPAGDPHESYLIKDADLRSKEGLRSSGITTLVGVALMRTAEAVQDRNRRNWRSVIVSYTF